MQLFYSTKINDDIISLDKIETNHCIKVLRHSVGDKIHVVDGFGNYFIAEILDFSKSQCNAKIIKSVPKFNKRPYYSHIAISPTKNHDRIEWFVEKAVEIGIDEISFINCERTIRKKMRMDRLEKIAKTAMKQTIKAYMPKINHMVDFAYFIENTNNKNGFICHLNNNIKKDIFDYISLFKSNKDTCVLIGPEGDFTQEEVNFTLKKGFKEISLGESRLRTETAGLTACHLINILYSK